MKSDEYNVAKMDPLATNDLAPRASGFLSSTVVVFVVLVSSFFVSSVLSSVFVSVVLVVPSSTLQSLSKTRVKEFF